VKDKVRRPTSERRLEITVHVNDCGEAHPGGRAQARHPITGNQLAGQHKKGGAAGRKEQADCGRTSQHQGRGGRHYHDILVRFAHVRGEVAQGGKQRGTPTGEGGENHEGPLHRLSLPRRLTCFSLETLWIVTGLSALTTDFPFSS